MGSTRALTDSSGSVVEQINYDSFGNGTGSSLTRYGYTGRELDADTGLYCVLYACGGECIFPYSQLKLALDASLVTHFFPVAFKRKLDQAVYDLRERKPRGRPHLRVA